MTDQIATAFLAGFVSLLVSLATFMMTRKKLKSEEERHNRELKRKLTEKLYDLRIKHYPKAFSITQRLHKGYVFSDTISKEDIEQVRCDLVEWNSSEASFILSDKTLDAYYKLHDALLEMPEEKGSYSMRQREAIWCGKNIFRSNLRHDVELLFIEDSPYTRRKRGKQILLDLKSNEELSPGRKDDRSSVT